MKAIMLPVFNRPDYLKQLLESFRRTSDWHLFIVFDKSPKTDELISIVKTASLDVIKVHMEVNEPRKGMVQNAWDGMEWAFRMGSEFTVCLEDDLWLSPDFFLLMNWYKRNFQDRPLAFGAYGAQGGNAKGEPDELLVTDYFTGNGWAVFPECWDKWFRPFWFNVDLGMKHFGPTCIGNDWNISGAFREFGVKMPFPALARSKHMGKTGGHFHPAIYEKLCGHLIVNKEHEVSEWRRI